MAAGQVAGLPPPMTVPFVVAALVVAGNLTVDVAVLVVLVWTLVVLVRTPAAVGVGGIVDAVVVVLL